MLAGVRTVPFVIPQISLRGNTHLDHASQKLCGIYSERQCWQVYALSPFVIPQISLRGNTHLDHVSQKLCGFCSVRKR
jgi:hypothetical protein